MIETQCLVIVCRNIRTKNHFTKNCGVKVNIFLVFVKIFNKYLEDNRKVLYLCRVCVYLIYVFAEIPEIYIKTMQIKSGFNCMSMNDCKRKSDASNLGVFMGCTQAADKCKGIMNSKQKYT